MLPGLDAESRRAVDRSAVHAEKNDRVREMARLDHQSRKAVEPADDLGELVQCRLQFFQTYVNRGGFFKCEIGRRGIALRRTLPG